MQRRDRGDSKAEGILSTLDNNRTDQRWTLGESGISGIFRIAGRDRLATLTAPMPRILIVDDEEHIVLLAATALKRAGFETLEATSATRALELWHDGIDVLLTDCVMADLFGDQLASRLWERKPELKVIFMSGNPIGSLELGVPLEENVNFVQKPFDFQTLVGAVRNAANGNAVNGRKI